MALTSGTKLGPYEIQSALGTGGMGEVYRAHDTRLGRDVAVKVLPDSVATDADRLLRFEQEARVLGTLSYPNCWPSTTSAPKAKSTTSSRNTWKVRRSANV